LLQRTRRGRGTGGGKIQKHSFDGMAFGFHLLVFIPRDGISETLKMSGKYRFEDEKEFGEEFAVVVHAMHEVRHIEDGRRYCRTH
jgi:hypothetical protein